jgi:hypothetical protein
MGEASDVVRRSGTQDGATSADLALRRYVPTIGRRGGAPFGQYALVADEVAVPRSDVIAVSRLLWSIGSEETTSHQHRVDCFDWGAKLDHLSGLPPHPTPGESTEAVIAFYRGVRSHLDDVIASLGGGRSEA